MIAFTGTPISFDDRNTQEVFGDYIDIYDLTRAVEDGATVPVYFEPRLIKVALAEGVTEETLDSAADELTDGLDDAERDRIEQVVAVINAVYGAPARLAALAADLVAHWEQRCGQMRPSSSGPGKALIVGGTREICAQPVRRDHRAAAGLARRRRRPGPDQGRLLRRAHRTRRPSSSTSGASRRTRRSRSGSRTPTTSWRSSSSRT